MENLPCKGCGGMCCGPVPITDKELKEIKKKLKAMPRKLRLELENQQRFYGTCIFFDQKNDKCGIHEVRPAICRAFGHFSNLKCFRNTNAAAAEKWHPQEQPVGILSHDFTWKDF